MRQKRSTSDTDRIQKIAKKPNSSIETDKCKQDKIEDQFIDTGAFISFWHSAPATADSDLQILFF